MRAREWMGMGVFISLVLVTVSILGGWFMWERVSWRLPTSVSPVTGSCGELQSRSGMGPGMVGTSGPVDLCLGDAIAEERVKGEKLSLEAVHTALESYFEIQSIEGLEVAEIMEFENHFYSIVREQQTGIGAMELLVDKWSGAVMPEMGPNVMWNTKYSMHQRGGMMGMRAASLQVITADEALAIAQVWLENNQPGMRVEDHAVPFYGYYTIHTMDDDGIVGMLSVHDSSGQVWYHTWHGAFIAVDDGEHTQ